MLFANFHLSLFHLLYVRPLVKRVMLYNFMTAFFFFLNQISFCENSSCAIKGLLKPNFKWQRILFLGCIMIKPSSYCCGYLHCPESFTVVAASCFQHKFIRRQREKNPAVFNIFCTYLILIALIFLKMICQKDNHWIIITG